MATFEYCALEFLDMWFLYENGYRASITATDEKTRLDGLFHAAAYFRIARNMPTQHDIGIGKSRYEPVLELICTLESTTSGAIRAETVVTFARDLATCYGSKDLLSAASKFLWLVYRDPVVIYDGQAFVSLGKPCGHYAGYVDAWEERWQRDRKAIEAACATLPQVFRYGRCGDKVIEAQVAAVSTHEWFQRRVLDVKLWVEGGPSSPTQEV